MGFGLSNVHISGVPAGVLRAISPPDFAGPVDLGSRGIDTKMVHPRALDVVQTDIPGCGHWTPRNSTRYGSGLGCDQASRAFA